jgi:probable HAF family extracellular repeat protein
MLVSVGHAGPRPLRAVAAKGSPSSSLRLVTGIARLRVPQIHSGGSAEIALPLVGVPRGARVRAVMLQASSVGRGVVTFGRVPGATVSVGRAGSRSGQTSVAGGLVATNEHLVVRVSGRPAHVSADVVGVLFEATGSGETLHSAVGETASLLGPLTLRRGRSVVLSLPAAAPAKTTAVLATITASAGAGVIGAGPSAAQTVPILTASTTGKVSATALLPVSSADHLVLTSSRRGKLVTSVRVLGYVAPNSTGAPGATVQLSAGHSLAPRAPGLITAQVAGERGLSAADAATPPTAALVGVSVAPGRGDASLLPVAGSTNGGRVVSAEEASVPYLSVGSRAAASATLVVPLRADGSMQLRSTSSRVRLRLLGGLSGDIVLRATTLLTSADLAALSSADEGTLRFQGEPPGLNGIAVGVVLAAGITPRTPHGLLRKVTGVSRAGGDLTLDTESASVFDVLEQGSISVHATPSPSDVAAFSSALRGVHRSPLAHSAGSGGSPVGAEFEWFPTPNHPVGPAKIAVTGGGLQISPDFNFNASASLFPPSLKASVTVGAHESLDAHLHTTGGFTDLSASQELFKEYFTPVDVQIGPIPIFFVPEAVIQLSLGGDAGGELTAGISQSRTFTYGVGLDTTRSGGPFYLINDTTPDHVEPEAPRFKGSASLTLSATAGLRFLIDWATGPEVSIGPFLEATADTAANPWWRTYWGFEAAVGFSINLPFPWNHLGFSQRVADVKFPLGNAGGPYATVEINPKQLTVQRGATQQFTANVTGAVGPEVEWSTDGGTISNTGLFTAPMKAGTYHVTVKSSDEHAAYDKAEVIVPAQAPSAPTGASATPTPLGATVTWNTPADDGGVSLSRYNVVANPGGAALMALGSSNTAHFFGLKPGTAYTFTVTATNSAGLTGPVSGPSAPVTPYNNEHVVLEPEYLRFPAKTPGKPSSPLTLTLYASSQSALTISSVALGGAEPSLFEVQSDNCSGRTLPANGWCTITVAFTPKTSTAVTALLEIYDNDPSSPQRAVLSNEVPQVYHLGTLGGASSEAVAINNSGQVAGWAENSSQERHAFSWTDGGGMEDLGTLSEGAGSYEAREVNNAGQVIGDYQTTSGSTRAFAWTQGGALVDIGTLGGSETEVIAQNNSGEVVGWSKASSGEAHVFSWTKAGGMVDVGIEGQFGQPLAVNEKGEIVGASGHYGAERAFSWTQSEGVIDLTPFLGPEELSIATSINNSGEVVGTYGKPSETSFAHAATHAFVWTHAGGFEDLGTLCGSWAEAVAVNNGGEVIGQSETCGYNPRIQVFSVRRGGKMESIGELPGLGTGTACSGCYYYASTISQSGEIVGTFSNPASRGGFAWTQSGGLAQLEVPYPNSFGNRAPAVNDFGQVAGTLITGSPQYSTEAVVWNTSG